MKAVIQKVPGGIHRAIRTLKIGSLHSYIKKHVKKVLAIFILNNHMVTLILLVPLQKYTRRL